MSQVIQTTELTKTYTRYEKQAGLVGSMKSLFHREKLEKTAVDAFTLRVDEGEFVGMIGPNGAGKTTLIKMLTGIIAPSAGRLDVLGHYPNALENEFKRKYAVVMGQKSQLFHELTPADTFLLFKELYSIPQDAYKRTLSGLVELFQVEGLLNVQVRTLSLGERMKMELICALLHAPRLLFLDEPTLGLDAVAQKQMRGFLREVNRTRGTTILLTSHYMEDVRSLCSRCVVIAGGRKLYDGGQAALFERYQTHRKITVSFDAGTDYAPREPITMLSRGEYAMSFMALRKDANAILRDMLAHTDVRDITIEEEDIGNVVERIYADAGGASA